MASNGVFVRRGGGDGPALLLLHGLGATGEVWDGLIHRRAVLAGHWPGSWVPVVLKGLGHNAHVEDPAALLPLLDRLAASVG